MSTKIYNGFKILERDPLKLLDFFQEKSKKISDIRDEIFKKNLIERMVSKLDKEILTGKEIVFDSNKSVMFDTWKELKEKIEEGRKSPYRTLYDYSCEWAIIPINRKKYTLSIIYTERSEFVEEFSKGELIQYYGYWNNTDKDEICSDKEWNQRKRDWDTLGYEPVARRAFTYKILDQYWEPFIAKDEFSDEYLKYANDQNRRIKTFLEDNVCNYYYNNKLTQEERDENTKNFSFGYIFDARDWANDTDEGKQVKENILTELISKLRPYTVEDFYGK